MFKSLLNFLLPQQCYQCQTIFNTPPALNTRYPYCQDCYLSLPFTRHTCQQCGLAISASQDYCGQCLSAPPPFDYCFCAFAYEAPIRAHICDFKYNQKPQLSQALASMLAREIIEHELERPELLIPVPMHLSKLRSRGYNQATLLAQQLGKILDIPVAINLLHKHKTTPAQVELSWNQRKKNLRNAFSLTAPVPAKHVAVVDDVFTTGTTCSEIANILTQSNVEYCQVWGLAHTL